MIRRGSNGKYYCDGHDCGYPLAWFPGDPDEGTAGGEWVCLDCSASMYGSRSDAASTKAEITDGKPLS